MVGRLSAGGKSPRVLPSAEMPILVGTSKWHGMGNYAVSSVPPQKCAAAIP